jgi:hypothetical protein
VQLKSARPGQARQAAANVPALRQRPSRSRRLRSDLTLGPSCAPYLQVDDHRSSTADSP